MNVKDAWNKRLSHSWELISLSILLSSFGDSIISKHLMDLCLNWIRKGITIVIQWWTTLFLSSCLTKSLKQQETVVVVAINSRSCGWPQGIESVNLVQTPSRYWRFFSFTSWQWFFILFYFCICFLNR